MLEPDSHVFWFSSRCSVSSSPRVASRHWSVRGSDLGPWFRGTEVETVRRASPVQDGGYSEAKVQICDPKDRVP